MEKALSGEPVCSSYAERARDGARRRRKAAEPRAPRVTGRATGAVYIRYATLSGFIHKTFSGHKPIEKERNVKGRRCAGVRAERGERVLEDARATKIANVKLDIRYASYILKTLARASSPRPDAKRA